MVIESGIKFKDPKSSSRLSALALLATCLYGLGLLGGPQESRAAGTKKVDTDISVELRSAQSPDALNDLKALRAEMLVAKSEARAMSQLDKLLAKYRGTRLESQLWLRKAELYMRQAKTARFFEYFRDGEVVRRGMHTPIEPSNRKTMEKAIETYEYIQQTFPDGTDLDLVFFNNAFVRQVLGQNKEAAKRYETLIERYEHSNLVPDAYLALGEMKFDSKDFEGALNQYEKVERYPGSRVYPYGVYKAAWALYNLQRTEEALKKLEGLVKASSGTKVGGGLDLRREALSDMVIFYSEGLPASNARSYFARFVSDEECLPYLLKLSRIYERHSRHADQSVVLLDIVKIAPRSKERVLAERDMIQTFELVRDREKAVNRLLVLEDHCRDQDELSSEVDAARTCADTLVELSLRLSAKWHRMWLKDKNRDELKNSAVKAYGVLFGALEKFPKSTITSKDRQKSRFGYAELLFATQDFRNASTAYRRVAEDLSQLVERSKRKRMPASAVVSNSNVDESVDPKLLHDSAYGALVSLERSVGEKWDEKSENEFRSLAQLYLKYNPVGQYRDQVAFKGALIDYEHERFNDCEKVFLQLSTSKDAKVRSKSQDLYLDILNHTKRYAQMSDFARKALSDEQDPERVKSLTLVMHEAGFTSLQEVEKKGRLDEALVGYQKFAEEHASSKLADKAWWNHIQILVKQGKWSEAAEAARLTARKFPKSEYALQGLTKAARIYEETGQLFRAAQACEELASFDSQNADKWKLLAGDFYAIDEQYEKSRKILSSLRGSEKPETASHAQNRLNWIEVQQLSSADPLIKQSAMNSMANSPDFNQKARAWTMLAEEHFQANRLPEAFRTAAQVVAMEKRVDAEWKARARLVQARVLDREFRDQSTKTRADRMAMVLAIKTEKLDKAQRAYQDVTRYGWPSSSVEALRRMSGLYGHYATSVRGAQIQGEIAPQDRQALEGELEKLAMPMEERQVEALGVAIAEARKSKIRDGSLGEMSREMDRLNMKPVGNESVVFRLPAAQLPTFGVGITSGAPNG